MYEVEQCPDKRTGRGILVAQFRNAEEAIRCAKAHQLFADERGNFSWSVFQVIDLRGNVVFRTSIKRSQRHPIILGR